MKRTLVFATLLVACAGLAHAKPAVVVKTPVLAPDFAENLDTGKAQVEAALSAALIAASTKRFPIIEWTTTAATSEAVLSLALTEESGAGNWTEVSLRWSGKIGAGASVTLPNLEAIGVYDSFDPAREMHDPVALAALLKAKVDAWFAQSANRKEFSTAFVNLVPIARGIGVANGTQHVVLPFSMSDEKIGAASKLVVHFVTRDGGAEHSGSLSVTELAPKVVQSKRQTSASVKLFKFDTISDVTGWDARIPLLLGSQVSSWARFDDYVLSEAGVNGNAVSP
ncbi:MAG: hypothetical protein H7Y89_08090 [Steroidobacteraceae bacterium]|nr:hypothetical protein [Steroidobacteraceae bacterium]